MATSTPFRSGFGQRQVKNAEDGNPTAKDKQDKDGGQKMPSKPGLGDRSLRKVPLRTNVFECKLNKETTLYRYEVTIFAQDKDSSYQREMTKGATDDHRRELKRSECFEWMWMLVEENKDVFTQPYAALYDRRKLYFSLAKLPFSKRTFSLFAESAVKISLEFAGQITIGNFDSEVDRDLGKRTRDQQQALEVLTSQVLYYQQKYVQLGRSVLDTTGNEDPENDLGGGKYLASGFSKGVRIIEGKGPEPCAALQLDQKKSALYKPQFLIHTILDMLGGGRRPSSLSDGLKKAECRLLDHQLSGVVVAVANSKRGRKFEIKGLTQKSAAQLEIEIEDKKKGIKRIMSVFNYFKEMKRQTLDFPGLQCLIEKTSRQTNYYPPEVLSVCENQRVPIYKQTPEQMQKAIKKCALKPSERQEQLENRMVDSGVLHNQFLASLGMEMMQKGMEVQGRVLPQPTIRFQGTATKKVDLDGNWDMRGNDRWLIPGKIEGKWMVLCTDIRCNGRSLISFLDKLMDYAKKTGILMGGAPEKMDCEVESVEHVFNVWSKKGVEFILVILDNRKDSSVKDMVKLLEQKYQVLTQCVRTQIAEEIGNPRPDRNGRQKNSVLTIMNILAKTNMKLGGLNFAINTGGNKWLKGGVLFLGVDVNHPPPQSAEERIRGVAPREPSVVGMVGCGAEEWAQFRYTGEHWYQDPRVETVTSMKDLTLEFLSRYRKSAETVSPLPRSVILFRDGVSEGQYKMLQDVEIPAMKKAFEELNFSPKLSVVVVLKRHTLRLMNLTHNPNARATQQDIPVGTVVDHTVVHPTNWEFYLQSHRAIQGTAKCCKYCVVFDENGLTQNEVEDVAYILAHSHQIVSKSVSLPAPVYGAHEMADRGKKLYRAEMGGSEASSNGSSTTELPDWEEFSIKHRVGGTKLEERKHWA